MLPPVDPNTGYLPLGGHAATLLDVQQRFVVQAPHAQQRRALVFEALSLYFVALRGFFPSGLALVDGGFVTHKVNAPHDVDVAVFPDDPSAADSWSDERFTDFQGMLTLQDVIVGGQGAGYFTRVQPFGGLVDSFIAAPQRETYWRELWGAVRGPNGDAVLNSKGYVEVRW